ncbi:MAG: hypothetical protein FWD57_06660 [Polyangiaceae bacterium]|nr:hypothetical protein [Polyangiaceae bacterium]
MPSASSSRRDPTTQAVGNADSARILRLDGDNWGKAECAEKSSTSNVIAGPKPKRGIRSATVFSRDDFDKSEIINSEFQLSRSEGVNPKVADCDGPQ